jgi:hypothetical protein
MNKNRLFLSIYMIFILGINLSAQTRGELELVTPNNAVASTGKQWAVFIAIDQYREWGTLLYPVKDAHDVKKILQEYYVIDEIRELYNKDATIAAIRRLFIELQDQTGPNDSVFIFHAGHGFNEERSETSFWIPTDGGKAEDIYTQLNWLSHRQIRSFLRSLKARHVFLISDSCFSGDFLDTKRGAPETIINYPSAYDRKSRQAMSSGASEEVDDLSEFASRLKDVLMRTETPYITPDYLLSRIKEAQTTRQLNTIPILAVIPDSGHDLGGSFLFFRKNPKQTVQPILEQSMPVVNPVVNQEEVNKKEEQARNLADEIAWFKTISVIKDTVTYTRAMAAINGDTVGGTYTLTIGASFPVGSVVLVGTDGKPAKTVILKGTGSTYILSNNGNGSLFTLSGNKITLILDGNITLDGNYQKNSVVNVFGGTLIMKSGSTIRNARDSGVSIHNGQFNMDGGNISNNMHDGMGGGVWVVNKEGVFIMNGGTINGNKAEQGGGGVCVTWGEFIMNGGTISGNSVDRNWGGGGVCSYSHGSFTMYGGTITGNSVINADGGGVFVGSNGRFVKSGGTIDATNKARKGKVAFYLRSNNSSEKRDATAGPSVNISNIINGRSGGWE